MVLWLLLVNLQGIPFRYPPNRQLAQTKAIARVVFDQAEGKPFNFAVLAERNYEGAYMYFFEMWNIPAKIVIADKLDDVRMGQEVRSIEQREQNVIIKGVSDSDLFPWVGVPVPAVQ